MNHALPAFLRSVRLASALRMAGVLAVSALISGTACSEEYLWEADKDQFTGWKFDGTAVVEPSEESLKIEVSRGNPQFFSPRVEIDAENQRSIFVHMKLPVGMKAKGCVLFVTEEHPEWSDELAVDFECRSNGEWSEYVIDMSANPHWKGKIAGIRFQPFFCEWPLPEDQRTVELKSIGIPTEN